MEVFFAEFIKVLTTQGGLINSILFLLMLVMWWKKPNELDKKIIKLEENLNEKHKELHNNIVKIAEKIDLRLSFKEQLDFFREELQEIVANGNQYLQNKNIQQYYCYKMSMVIDSFMKLHFSKYEKHEDFLFFKASIQQKSDECYEKAIEFVNELFANTFYLDHSVRTIKLLEDLERIFNDRVNAKVERAQVVYKKFIQETISDFYSTQNEIGNNVETEISQVEI